VDDEHIYVGDWCMIAPNVVITSGHPILPILREHHYVYNLPVHIGRNVWIGSGVQILPGVTIGDNSVIGAGSVVTNDIPANVVALGAPCRVFREIGEKDRRYFWRQRELDVWE
jgi:galactoside O-acetyltransferase